MAQLYQTSHPSTNRNNNLSIFNTQSNLLRVDQFNQSVQQSARSAFGNLHNGTQRNQSAAALQSIISATQQQSNIKMPVYGVSTSNGETFSVRTHLNEMENKLSDLVTELKYHRQQVGIIKSEKDTLDSILSMKIDDVRKTVKNEEIRVKKEMDRYQKNQQTEGGQLNYKIKSLQIESNTMQQKLLSLQRRIQEMEGHVGIVNEK